MAETPNGETQNQPPLKNDGNSSDSSQLAAEIERMRKEKEQAEMRANQLANELKAKADAEEAARLKKLEEENEWKQLAEQEKAKREALEQEREAAAAKVELQNSQSEIFKEFPQEVVEVATEAGLGLSEASEEAKEKLRASLTKLSEKIAGQAGVRPNNPSVPQPSGKTREELLQAHAQNSSPRAFQEAVSGLGFVKHAKEINGIED